MNRERRTICRECGRGSDAPHRRSCKTGRDRAAHESFRLSDLIRTLSR